MAALGLVPNERGRSRGLLLFDESTYKQALQTYVANRRESGSGTSFLDYDEWRKREYRAGRTWPAGASIRLKYGGWSSALRVATSPTATLSDEPIAHRTPNLSAQLLHLARSDMEKKISEIGDSVGARERDPLIRNFLRDYAGTFESDRRKWLREMILLDPDSVDRRLRTGAPKLTKRQLHSLGSTPPKLDLVLTDRYLDQTLAQGVSNTDGWLRQDAQAELDAVGEQVKALYGVLRAARNLVTHDSKESRDRLSDTLDTAGLLESEFEFKHTITELSIIRWLSADSQRRLKKVAATVPEIWKAMVAAEAVLRAQVIEI